ncbi:hypothetical protein M430DRAFT_31589 [Amorphotheca resinae ATCC 22711]|jgi:hypothetical protein|uniref:Uncharacterized protein n=1 Tax=Amorphotheca resinae ATCC 22711 TaxID=857342 RepID=A0A2T3APP5_AMORE|nr:hypothetical protein M430DRAFT_31589 [Amorphotheca resinae ATCC 22711]PSS06981.1 hypothetical protein M430DRAFT_31589 [Amorphotheca resinae ATCC 22711]
MTTCATCTRPLTFPPTIHYLLTTYPTITPLYSIHRSLRRCQHCDLVLTYKQAIEAELPPPSYTNPVKEIERSIELAQELILEGVQAEALQNTLPRMRERLAQKTKERDEEVRRAWEWFWGIWGKVE